MRRSFFIFVRSLEKAQELEKQLRGHELQKEYVCKVRGEFPRFVVYYCLEITQNTVEFWNASRSERTRTLFPKI